MILTVEDLSEFWMNEIYPGYCDPLPIITSKKIS
jgi:hypothetical protein